MKKIFIKIERTRDCYSAYAENVEGIYAGGDTISELKESVNFSNEVPASLKLTLRESFWSFLGDDPSRNELSRTLKRSSKISLSTSKGFGWGDNEFFRLF